MAEVFERASAVLSTLNETTVYQAPNTDDRDRSITLSCLAANIDGVDSADVTIAVRDAAGQLLARTAYQIPVPAKSTLALMPNRLILKRGYQIRAQASLVNRIEVTVSTLEITPDVT